MFLTDGVAPAQDHRVRLPALADLGPDLAFDCRQPCLVHTAEPGGLVLDAQQNEVPVADGRASGPLCARRFFDARGALLLQLQLRYRDAVDFIGAVGEA